MNKILAIMAMAAVSAMAVSASRIGPVSTYGELKANGSKLSGSCETYANTAVQVKGMSLYWSSGAEETSDFYSEKGINRLVDSMGVEVVRFAMGVSNPEFDKNRGYLTGGEKKQKALLKAVMDAAIEKDIYVIIDWHIESSNGYTDDAISFFTYAAKEYGKLDNVIFEVWNEPKDGAQMSQVADHAQKVIDAIRNAGSDNLVLVGSPEWSSHPDDCAKAGINDNNYGCTLHFYAATDAHQVKNGDNNSYNARAESALNAGVPVFATEWGSVMSDGKGSVNTSASDAWVSWMSQKGVSWTYWNASAVTSESQTSAIFTNVVLDHALPYSESGKYIKSKLGGGQYKSCSGATISTPKLVFSTGVASGTKTSMIDDMEDGNRYTYLGGAWNGVDDHADGGKSSISNEKIVDDFGKENYNVILPSDNGNSSGYMVGINDIKLDKGGLSYPPFFMIGLDLQKDTSLYADFKNCKVIKYKYKGASHNFRIETSDITDWNFFHVNKDNSETWREVEIPVEELFRNTWETGPSAGDISLDKARRLAWELKAPNDVPASAMQPKLNYLYIDDLSCEGLSFTAESVDVTTSSSSTVKSSSSKGDASSSSTDISSGSSSSAKVVVKDLVLIDDVEDVDEVLETTGTWYAYTDEVPGGKSSITNEYDATLPGYVVVFPGSKDASNGTKGFVGLTGIKWDQAEYAEAPFVALGINMVEDTSKGFDLSKCGAISYRYKGSQHKFKVQDGQVLDYAYHQASVDEDAAEWTTVVFEWDDIVQPSWGEDVDLNKAAIKKMSWEVVGYKGFDEQPTTDYLYVDDLKCVEGSSVGIRIANKAASALKLSVNGSMLNVATTAAARIQVFDMMGNLVMNRVENSAGNHQVSLEGMNRGNYVVRVKTAGAAQTARISLR